MNTSRNRNVSLRSPFENILSMFNISGLPQGHEKPLKHALYNALAMFLLILCVAAGYALFLILEPFFKPLLWALLVGSVLYPIKRRIAKQLTSWFTTLEDTQTSLVVGVARLPIHGLDCVSELLGGWLTEHVKALLCMLVTLPLLHVLYYYTPSTLTCLLWRCIMLSNAMFSWIVGCLSTTMVLTLGTVYLGTVAAFWTPQRSDLFKWAALAAWLIFSAYICNLINTFQVPLFFLLQAAAAGGFISDKEPILNEKAEQVCLENQSEIEDSTHDLQNKDFTKEMKEKNDDLSHENIIEADNITSTPVIENIGDTIAVSQAILRKPLHLPTTDNENSKPTSLESDVYFKGLFYACGFLVLWKQLWVLPLLPIPVLIYFFKRIWKFLNMDQRVGDIFNKFLIWLNERKTALIPPPVRGLQVLITKTHGASMQYAKESVDTVSSAVVILGLLLFMTCAGLFIAMQIYAEGIALVQISGTVVNNTIIHNPELLSMLPPGVEESMDSLFDNAYQYGREGISKLVRSVLQDADSTQAQRLEAQILTLWDRAYQSWMDDSPSGAHGPRVPGAAVKQSWDSFIDDIYRTPGINFSELLNISALVDWAKQNVGTLSGVLESAWSLLRGNVELLLGLVSTTVYLLIGSSSAVISWILNTVVFLTTLFYLLSSSDLQYRPVEVVGSLIGSGTTARNVGNALEAAIAGVFCATLKMAVFYGLWTWLIHNIFGVSIVYVPSVIAACLAAVPFLGTYCACFPGALELWFVQGRFWSAILLIVFQFAPTALLDTTLYNEIKGGGHPYLTGLAIAGGLWCLGPEGALLGPLLLCLLVVATDLSSAALRESPLAPTRRFHRMNSIV